MKLISYCFKLLVVIGFVSALVYIEMNDVIEYRTMKMDFVKFQKGSKITIETDSAKHLCRIYLRSEENGKVSIFGESEDEKNFGFGLTFTTEGVIAGAAIDREKNVKYRLTLDTTSGTFIFRNSQEPKQP